MLAEAITVNATRPQRGSRPWRPACTAHIADPLAAKAAAVGHLAQQVRREAYVMAYADGFWLVG